MNPAPNLILIGPMGAGKTSIGRRLAERFGLRFELFNRAFVGRCRQERGFSVNPWATHNRFVISYPLLRRPEHREALLRHLEALAGSGRQAAPDKATLSFYLLPASIAVADSVNPVSVAPEIRRSYNDRYRRGCSRYTDWNGCLTGWLSCWEKHCPDNHF